MHRRLVVLDGGHQVIGVALIDQIVCGLLLGMQCIDGDDTPGEVETAGECAHGRDFIALAVDLDLSEDQTRAVFERRDHHPAPLLSLLARRRANPCHPLPSMATGACAEPCWSAHVPMALSRVSGGSAARMLWKVVIEGAV